MIVTVIQLLLILLSCVADLHHNLLIQPYDKLEAAKGLTLKLLIKTYAYEAHKQCDQNNLLILHYELK